MRRSSRRMGPLERAGRARFPTHMNALLQHINMLLTLLKTPFSYTMV
jgi:hypothetical protein